MRNDEWGAAVNAVAAAGFLTNVRDIAPGVFVAVPGRWGWSAAARELAFHLPGQLLPGKSGGIGWKCGSGPMQGTLIEGKSLAGILQGREAVRSLVPIGERPELPFSIGACARIMVRWAITPQVPEKATEALLGGSEGMEEARRIQYHDCTPGRYPAAVMYDCTSYYFRLLQRLPSVRVSTLPSGPLWHRMSADERSRWRDLLDAVEGAKVLRNAVWGCMLGSYERRTAYTRDKATGRVKVIKPCYGPGPNRPAAIVLARSAWELCRRASEECGSVYSTVDSVTSINGTRPAVWDSVGLPWGPRVEGEASIVGLGCWQVGPQRTEPFVWHTQGRFPAPMETVARAAMPTTEYYRCWL